MKKILFITALFAASLFWAEASAQSISFPAPELRTDTVKPLNSDGVTFVRPTAIINKLVIRGNRVPPTFYFHIVDSLGYNRFGVTKNGMLISGTHHNPTTSVDGLVMMGRGNTLFGADAVAIGKQVVNQADTTMALGYYYTVPETKHNMTIIGYGSNRIEMAADSGRFVGYWKFGIGGQVFMQPGEPDIPANSFAFWVNGTDFWLVLDSEGVQKKLQLQ
jgi:hypothetical protein